MSEAEPPATSDAKTTRRRRLILYCVSGLALAVVVALAIAPTLKQKPKERKVTTPTPVILARIQLKPVGGSAGRGLAEIIRRDANQSMRVLAARLKPNREGGSYALMLSGGKADERRLGGAVVGDERIFVGEAKVTIEELERHKWVELRRVEAANRGEGVTVLRGRVPR